jgi:hypothetical protein
MIMESVLFMDVSYVYDINVKRTSSLREPSLLAVEIPTHHHSDQQVRENDRAQP